MAETSSHPSCEGISTAFADLHAHSAYSEKPQDWYISTFGARESYSDPLTLYENARQRGMTYVTITDHNCIDGVLLLQERHPEKVFTGVEVTAAFPEDDRRIHLLIYGFSPHQFRHIDRIRGNIYTLRDYLLAEGLPHSVAHATYPLEPGTLTTDHLEKLLLLFNTFEVMNGARVRADNEFWLSLLLKLTPHHIDKLRRKHNVEPVGPTPWIKYWTGGSDDHAGLFIGRTFTGTCAKSSQAFLRELAQGRTSVHGHHGDYRSFAFTVYKIIYEFLSKNKITEPLPLLGKLNEMLFRAGGSRKLRNMQLIAHRFKGKRSAGMSSDAGLCHLYRTISIISDRSFRILLQSIERDLNKSNLLDAVQGIANLLPVLFLYSPFLFGLSRLRSGRDLALDLAARLQVTQPSRSNRILFFADAYGDNERSYATCDQVQQISGKWKGYWKVATSYQGAAGRDRSLALRCIDLPVIHRLDMLLFSGSTIRVPSLMRSLEAINDENPDTIVLCTHGPVGLIGLLAAKLLNIRAILIPFDPGTVGFEKAPLPLIAPYTRWFAAVAAGCGTVASSDTVPEDDQDRGLLDAARMVKNLVMPLPLHRELQEETLKSVA